MTVITLNRMKNRSYLTLLYMVTFTSKIYNSPCKKSYSRQKQSDAPIERKDLVRPLVRRVRVTWLICRHYNLLRSYARNMETDNIMMKNPSRGRIYTLDSDDRLIQCYVYVHTNIKLIDKWQWEIRDRSPAVETNRSICSTLSIEPGASSWIIGRIRINAMIPTGTRISPWNAALAAVAIIDRTAWCSTGNVKTQITTVITYKLDVSSQAD